MPKWVVEKDVSDLTPDELRAAIDQGRTALSEILESQAPSPDDVATATEYDRVLDELSNELAGREQAEREQEQTLEGIRQRHQERIAEPEADEAAEPEATETEQADEAEQPEVTEQVEEPVVETKEPVAASARSTLARRTPRPSPGDREESQQKRQATTEIVAAPDVRGFSAGQELDFDAASNAFASKTAGFGSRGPNGGRQEYAVAMFKRPFEDELIAKGDGNDHQVVDYAANASRLPGGSLTAAAGWCAPSETIYDLCDNGHSTDGNWSLPEIQVNRGGIRYPLGPDFSSVYAGGFDLTEAEVIAGTEKTCVEVNCPEFDEVRLDAVGFCVTSNILSERGYPEYTAAFLKEAMIAHQNKVAAKLLNQAVTAAGTPLVSGGLGSIAGGVLTAVELLVTSQRTQYRWPVEQAVEAVAPVWLLPAMRADYSMRNGVDLQKVTNQMIQSYFAARNISIQFVYGWQDLPADAVEFPTTVQVMIYREGTFTKGTDEVISLNAVYDSTLLKQNQYTAAFFEEGVLLLQRCYGAKIVEIPVCVGGITGAASNTACLAAAAGTTGV